MLTGSNAVPLHGWVRLAAQVIADKAWGLSTTCGAIYRAGEVRAGLAGRFTARARVAVSTKNVEPLRLSAEPKEVECVVDMRP